MRLTLDKMNRIVIPKELRDRLSVGPGDALEISLTGDEIRLRPVDAVAVLTEKYGLLVCTSEVPLAAWDLDAFIQKQREARGRQLGGV